jgi:uncharacterized protein (TIGR03790 family)
MTLCIRGARLLPIVMAVWLTSAATARAQTGANVLVVVNSTSAASETIGRQYAARRAVPADNVCAMPLPIAESVSRDVYDTQIDQPIWHCIATRQAHDRILYIVLTKDVPIRISGTSGRSGTGASVDSELTLLYRRRTDASVPIVGFVPNPYYAAGAPAAVEAFSHRAHDVYLVTRLDGYTVQDALGLIDRGADAPADGVFVLGPRASSVDLVPNRWLAAAAERLQARGLGVLDEHAKPTDGASPVLGYYSWGSNNDVSRRRAWDFTFARGALAAMIVSTDARTFKEPPASWRPSDGSSEPFTGTTDSLVADLIRAGVTGASGNVDEPYLDASVRPDILFPAYASGRNLAESFYAALPYLSWQTVVLGDPLATAFPRTALGTDETDPPIDTATEVSTFFTRRQLAMMHPALSREAGAAFIRYQSRTRRGDAAGAREALEAAVAAEPRFIPARLELAAMDDRAGDRDREIAQYRAILTYSPNDPLALNNLAYALAVYRGNPEEALPFAERASTNARRDPELLGGTEILGNYFALGRYHQEPLVPYCLDTLAWVQHLLGRDAEAAMTIQQARNAEGVQTADMMWHAAVIYASINDHARAGAELEAALKIAPDLATREDVKKLRHQLAAGR